MMLPVCHLLRQPLHLRLINSNRKLFSQYRKHLVNCTFAIQESRPTALTQVPFPNIGLCKLQISRHKHSLVERYIQLPHNYWRRWHRLYIKWHMGSKFNEEDFFKGVIHSFLFISECVANGKTRDLYDLVTDEGMQYITYYTHHAMNLPQEAYLVKETDLVRLLVRSANIRSMENYDEHRNVKVVTCVVLIAYVTDLQKKLAESEVESKAKGTIALIREGCNILSKPNYVAALEFQRVYDQSLENALSDWMVARIGYKIPELKK